MNIRDIGTLNAIQAIEALEKAIQDGTLTYSGSHKGKKHLSIRDLGTLDMIEAIRAWEKAIQDGTLTPAGTTPVNPTKRK